MRLTDTIHSEFVSKRKTFLGAGPMSQVSVAAIIDLANHYKKPIAVIPSRRQIEARSLGGGYVNNWSTEDFVSFIRQRDKGNFVKISRDHSGPWQYKASNSIGETLTYAEAIT